MILPQDAYRVTEYLDVCRKLIDPTELIVAGLSDSKDEKHATARALAQVQVASRNLGFLTDVLMGWAIKIEDEEKDAAAAVRPNAG